MTKIRGQPANIDQVLKEGMDDTNATNDVPPNVKFEDCTISFAIDTSGSTLGQTLRNEQQAVLEVCEKLSELSRSKAVILPWDSEAESPLGLSNLNKLVSYGGTEPSCLLESRLTRQVLQKSTMWFLFTDGQIEESSVRKFARSIATHGLHGTACVTIVFAPAYGKPDTCNISVGVSVFAAAPDCLFLFFDTMSKKLYLLQCSGRFTQILELYNKSQPILDENTQWADLPQMRLSDLSSISIPSPQILSKDQLALPDGLVLNLKELWAGHLNDKATVDRIFLNDDNLKSLTLTAQTRGEVDAFQKWLEPFLDDSSSPLIGPPGDEGLVMESVRAIIEEMQTGITEERLQQLQRDLQNARDRESADRSSASLWQPNVTISRASVSAFQRSSQSAHGSRSLSSISPPVMQPQVRLPVNAELVTPGFRATDSAMASFKGRCKICGQDDGSLVFLLRKCRPEASTPGFPSSEAYQPVFCPLAVGNFPETDVISSSLCCDACSYTLAKTGKSLTGEALACVLPIVTYAINEQAYIKQLKLALKNRFHESILPQIWLAILVSTYQRLPVTVEYDLFRAAIKWSCKDLTTNIQCGRDMILEQQATTDLGRSSLRTAIANAFQAAYTTNGEGLFEYPLPGFLVMVLALDYAKGLPRLPNQIHNLVWHRLLFQVTQCCHDYLATNGQAVTQLKLAGMVLESNAVALDKDVKKHSIRSLRDLKKSLFGDRTSSSSVVSITIDSLVENDMLTPADLVTFRMLGESFAWVERNTNTALCVFLHFLARQNDKSQTTWQRFQVMRANKKLRMVFEDPSRITSKKVAELVDDLPIMAVGADE